jgi:hypothetical protein
MLPHGGGKVTSREAVMHISAGIGALHLAFAAYLGKPYSFCFGLLAVDKRDMSTKVARLINAPVALGRIRHWNDGVFAPLHAGSPQHAEQEYLLSDIDTPRTRAGHASSHDHPPSTSDHTALASEHASPKERVTLTPIIPLDAMHDADIFHRALHVWNTEHLAQLTWDEMTVPQQSEVQAIMRDLQIRRHVCPRRATSR